MFVRFAKRWGLLVCAVLVVAAGITGQVQYRLSQEKLDDSIACNRGSFEQLTNSLGVSVGSGVQQRNAWRSLFPEDLSKTLTLAERQRNLRILTEAFDVADRSASGLLVGIHEINKC